MGLADPGPPRVRPHRRCRDHDRPARPGSVLGRRLRLRGALRARPVRSGCRGRRRRRSTTSSTSSRATATCRRASPPRHPPSPATRQLGNLDRDLRLQPDLDRGRHQRRVHRGRRQALRGVRLARADGGLEADRRVRRGRRRAARRASRPRKGETVEAVDHRPEDDHRLAVPRQAEHRQDPRLRPRRRRARRDEEGARLRPRADLRRRRRRARAHPLARRARRRGARRVAGVVRRVGGREPRAQGAVRPARRRSELPEDIADALPVFEAGKEVSTRAASGTVINALAAELPELWGGSADLAESNLTTIKDGEVVHPVGVVDARVVRRPVRPRAALRHPRARDGRDRQRHRAARPDPRVRRHVPDLQRLHAPRRCAWPR